MLTPALATIPSRIGARLRRACLIGLAPAAALAAAMLIGASPAAAATTTTRGYITTSDGVKLAYAVTRPASPGQYPVALNYATYSNTEDPTSVTDTVLAKKLLADGFAVLGVSVRGSGCSGGTFDLFERRWATDGYQVVEWAAGQPWSDGKVAMFGLSMPAILSWAVAELRPPHLVAISPESTIADVYRDVAFPGGIPNVGFATQWYGLQSAYSAENLATGDATCLANYAQHTVTNLPKNVVLDQQEHPFDDAFWQKRSLAPGFSRIDVPALAFSQFGDEQVGSRVTEQLSQLDPSRTWIVFTNGNHFTSPVCDECEALNERFLRWAVKGEQNGWPSTPHVQLWQESHPNGEPLPTELAAEGVDPVKSWSVDLPRWPANPPATLTYQLHAGHLLSSAADRPGERSDSYVYSLPAPSVGADLVNDPGADLYSVPAAAGGSVAYTTAPLSRDVVTLGPASLDLWLSSTASDTDLQATISEVRPDGQEMYVARGWLRASQRKLDPALSTPTRPYQTHLAADVQPLTPGVPTYMRVEIFPFTHAFRKGSRIRVRIDAPTGLTGAWGFGYLKTPAIDRVFHDPAHPSQLVLGVLRGQSARAPLPVCGGPGDTQHGLVAEPCRPDPGPAPVIDPPASRRPVLSR
jgi:putative CocE/NonD family hydrolase